jgi:hypothetical protein
MQSMVAAPQSEVPMPGDLHIRELAYRLWELEGCPEGRQDAHWVRAERELQASSTRCMTSVPACLAAFAPRGGAPRIYAAANDEHRS